MSKIQAIQPKYQSPALKPYRNERNVSFNGATASVDELATYVAKGARPVEKGFRKGVTNLSIYLDGGKGEIQNQLINAAFTTTLAPLFIAFNPMTDQDKKTKEYTALRQPISAAIALFCSMPMTRAFNRWAAKLALNNMIKGTDLRMCLEGDLLKKEFRDKYKESTNKEKFLDDLKPKLAFDAERLNKKGKISRQYKVAAEKAYIDKQKTARQNIFAQLVGNEPKDINLEMVKGIPGFENKEALKGYLDNNNIYRKSFGQFLEDEFKFEIHKGGALDGQFKQATLNEKLSSIKALDFLSKIGLIEEGKVKEEDLAKMISKDRQEEKLSKILEKEIKTLDSAASSSKIADGIGAQSARISQLNSGKSGSITLEKLFNRFGYDENKLNSISKTKLSKILPEIADRLGKGKLEGFKEGSGIKDFALNMVKNKSSYISKNFEVLKKYSGILINVPICIISCSLLNWIYPRAVAKVFPSLVSDDKKGGNK